VGATCLTGGCPAPRAESLLVSFWVATSPSAHEVDVARPCELPGWPLQGWPVARSSVPRAWLRRVLGQRSNLRHPPGSLAEGWDIFRPYGHLSSALIFFNPSPRMSFSLVKSNQCGGSSTLRAIAADIMRRPIQPYITSDVERRPFGGGHYEHSSVVFTLRHVFRRVRCRAGRERDANEQRTAG
jgi:hypothetical protein